MSIWADRSCWAHSCLCELPGCLYPLPSIQLPSLSRDPNPKFPARPGRSQIPSSGCQTSLTAPCLTRSQYGFNPPKDMCFPSLPPDQASLVQHARLSCLSFAYWKATVMGIQFQEQRQAAGTWHPGAQKHHWGSWCRWNIVFFLFPCSFSYIVLQNELCHKWIEGIYW